MRGIINCIVGWAGLIFQFGLPLYYSYRSAREELLVRLPLTKIPTVTPTATTTPTPTPTPTQNLSLSLTLTLTLTPTR